MLKIRVKELVETIPLKSKIYTDEKPGTRAAKTSEVLISRRAHAVLDPAFPWNFAQAFVQLRQPLPKLVYESQITLAHRHGLKQPTSEDLNEALVIRHPNWKTKRGFLEALLLLPDLRLDAVGAHASLPVSVVMTYESLFWNVRDRLNDQLFMNEICFPKTRVIEFLPDYFERADPCDLMRRAAFDNDLDAVLQIFGSRTPREAQSPDLLANRVKSRIMAAADFVVRAGGSSSKIAVLDSARKIIVADKKNSSSAQHLGDDQIGLTALSTLDPGQSILETARRLTDNTQYEKMLSLQEAMEAAANASKK